MKGCKLCGCEISHRIKHGPGRPPTYCEDPTCIRLRAARRKRDERYRRIQHGPKLLGRVPRGHYYLPGRVLRQTEDAGRIDWDCFLMEEEGPVKLAPEYEALPDGDRKRVQDLGALADRWLERGVSE